MHQNILIKSVQKNLWSRGYQVKTPVPETENFDLVVNGFRVAVKNKMPIEIMKWDIFDVVAIVELSKVSDKSIISYYKGEVVSSNPKDIFIINKKINVKETKKGKEKSAEKDSAKTTKHRNSGEGRVGAHNADNN